MAITQARGPQSSGAAHSTKDDVIGVEKVSRVPYFVLNRRQRRKQRCGGSVISCSFFLLFLFSSSSLRLGVSAVNIPPGHVTLNLLSQFRRFRRFRLFAIVSVRRRLVFAREPSSNRAPVVA
jgi:hypothetical protein